MSKRRKPVTNTALKRRIRTSRHSIFRAAERNGFHFPEDESPTWGYARAASFLRKGIMRHGVPVSGWQDHNGHREPRGRLVVIGYGDWIAILRPMRGSKTLKLVTCYQAEFTPRS